MTNPTPNPRSRIPGPRSKKSLYLLAALIIILLATFLRFHNLETQSFWNDEGNSARLSERSISLIIEGTASDIHPPLYYLLLRGWRELAGDTEFGLRSLSTFLGIGLVALTMALAAQTQTFVFSPSLKSSIKNKPKKQKSHILILLTALLTAVNAPLIYYSQEARMYQLLAFLGLGSTVLLLHWLKHGADLRSKTAVLYALTLTAGLYTHYFFPAIIAAQALIMFAYTPPNVERFGKSLYALVRWGILAGTAVLLYVPWLPIFIRQAGGRGGTDLPLLDFLANAGQFLILGQTIEPENIGGALWGIGLLAAAGLVPFRRRFSLAQIVAILGLFIPVLLMWLAGTTTPPFYKFMLTAVPPLMLLAAFGFQTVSRFADHNHHRALYFVVLSLVGLYLLGSYVSLNNLYTNPAFARADYRSIAARIEAADHPNAAVILNAANQWEVFTYYYEDVDSVYPLPRGFPDPAQIEAELAELTEQYGRLYAIFWGEAERDPDRLVERWLDANAFKASEEWVGDVRFVTYAIPTEPPDEMETAINAQFGDSILLEGYTIQPANIRPGEILQISLFWQTETTLDTRYKVFLHLIGPDGQIITQRDSEPGGNLALTTTWPPNETIQDNHGLLIPTDTPAGQYTLLLGLYDIANPANRLQVETAEGAEDSLQIPIQINGI